MAEKWSSGATTQGQSTPRARARAILGIYCIGVCALRFLFLQVPPSVSTIAALCTRSGSIS